MQISKKYGLNPTQSICFFCGQTKRLMILGKLKGDVKAPNKVLADYQPCKECLQKISRGRLVVEVTTEDTGSIPISPGMWPTGRWCVIGPRSARLLFKDVQGSILLPRNLYEELRKRTNKVFV